jgi:hypothetical protein
VDEEQKTQAVRLQRKAIERRRDEVIREARFMATGDARKARPDLLQALHDLDEAQRRLVELTGEDRQTTLPLLPENAGQHAAPVIGADDPEGFAP